MPKVHQVKSVFMCDNCVLVEYNKCNCLGFATRKYVVTDSLGRAGFVLNDFADRRYWNTYSAAYKYAKRLNEWQDEYDTKLQTMVMSF